MRAYAFWVVSNSSLFTDNSSKAEEWAAAVIMARRQIAAIIDKNNGPFYVHIGKESQSHLSVVRFVGSGGRKPSTASASIAAPVSTSPPKVQPKSDVSESLTQRNLFDLKADID